MLTPPQTFCQENSKQGHEELDMIEQQSSWNEIGFFWSKIKHQFYITI